MMLKAKKDLPRPVKQLAGNLQKIATATATITSPNVKKFHKQKMIAVNVRYN